MKNNFKGQLGWLIDLASRGSAEDVDRIMACLEPDPTLTETRNVDFALGLVSDPGGHERIRYYLFKGSQIQRNYASLCLNRMLDWKPVKQAFEQGLIDEIQAYAR